MAYAHGQQIEAFHQAPLHESPPSYFKGKLPSKHTAARPLIDATKYVRFIYLVPADSMEKPEYKTSIANAARNLQQFYKDQLSNGKTFNLYEPIVEVYKSSHPAMWYSTNPDADWAGDWKFWFNVVYDAFSLSGGSFDDPDNFWVVYVDALPVCPFLQGGGESHVVAMGANDLRGLTGKSWLPICDEVVPDYSSCRYVGGLGHELGHAFGLPHPPGCDDGQPVTCDSESIMFLGYLSYPDTYFSANEKIALNNSAFIGDVTTGSCAIDCANLTIDYSYSDSVDVSICNGESYFAGGSAQTVGGIYEDRLLSRDGCDSLVFTKLKVLPIFKTTVPVTICKGEGYFAGGELRTSSGLYTDTLKNVLGCDSIVVTNLIVHPVYEIIVDTTICSGDSYFAGGFLRTISGTYSDSLLTKLGCDSVIVTKLSVAERYQQEVEVSICQGTTYFAGGDFQNVAGTYADTLNSKHGCDSIIVTNLKVLPSYEATVEVSICQGEGYLAGGQLQHADGYFVDRFTTTQGCDSLVTTHLRVLDTYDQNVEVFICPGETYLAGGFLQSTDGTYVDSLAGTMHCDSIITTHLHVFEIPKTVVEISICKDQTYMAGGSLQDKPGTYYDTLSARNGCDSIVVTQLTEGICTGVLQPLENSVSVYPVPTNKLLYIESQKIHHIELSNALGQCLINTTVNVIDFTLLPEGYYYVRVFSSPTEFVTRKVLFRPDQ